MGDSVRLRRIGLALAARLTSSLRSAFLNSLLDSSFEGAYTSTSLLILLLSNSIDSSRRRRHRIERVRRSLNNSSVRRPFGVVFSSRGLDDK